MIEREKDHVLRANQNCEHTPHQRNWFFKSIHSKYFNEGKKNNQVGHILQQNAHGFVLLHFLFNKLTFCEKV